MHRSFIGLFAFALVSGLTACAVDGADEVTGTGGPTAEVASASTGNCSYTFVRDNISVIKGEGGLDPALELDVDTTALSSTVNFNGTIKVGASHTADATLGTGTVAAGSSVTISWTVDALEFDPLNADDRGSGGGSLTFTCSGTGSKTDSDQIDLNGSIIDVRVKATW